MKKKLGEDGWVTMVIWAHIFMVSINNASENIAFSVNFAEDKSKYHPHISRWVKYFNFLQFKYNFILS